MDIPTVLVVTGVMPYFVKAPSSYTVLPTLPDAYLQFNIEVSFKPESADGKYIKQPSVTFQLFQIVIKNFVLVALHMETGCGVVEWIHLAQDRDCSWAVVNAVMNLWVLAPRSQLIS
jgi:hypothetical protein